MANSSTATVTIIISGFGIIIQVSSRDQSFSDSAQNNLYWADNPHLFFQQTSGLLVLITTMEMPFICAQRQLQ